MEKRGFVNSVKGQKEKGKGKEKEEEEKSKCLEMVESDDEVEFIGETRPLYIYKNEKEKIVSRIGDKFVRVGASNQTLDGFLLKTGSGSKLPNLQMDNRNTDDQTACYLPRGHLRILDEQIGVVYKFCPVVFCDMKHIFPDFKAKKSSRRFLGESEHPEVEEEDEGKNKWLALVDGGNASRNDDTKCLALVGSDEESDDVEFIGETCPVYKNTNEMKKVSSMDVDIDEGGGDNKLVLVGASNQPLGSFWLKTCSGSKVGSVGGRSPGFVTYDEVAASSTTKRRKRVDSISLSDSEEGSMKVCEKRKGIVSRLRSSSNSKSLKKDARKKRSYSDFCLDEDSEGDDNEQKQKRVAKNRRLHRARTLNVNNEKLRRSKENAPTLALKFRFPEEDETPPPVKEDWEVEIDNLFADSEMVILQPEIGSNAQSMMDNGKTDDATACCHPEGHLHILDEQIGLVCEYCPVVFQEMKYIFPDFKAEKSCRRHDRRLFDESKDSEVSDASTNSCAQASSVESVGCNTKQF